MPQTLTYGVKPMSDLPTTVDSLDAIPEDVRKFYTTSSGENGKTQYNLDAT